MHEPHQQHTPQPCKVAFANGHEAAWLRLSSSGLASTLVQSDLKFPNRVMVLIGGAAGMEKRHEALVQRTIALLADLSEELHLIVVDGGTQSGVKAFMGEARAAGNYHFPLLGVVVEKLVQWPEQAATAMSAPAEPNHTHFILVPGETWGEESIWLSEIAGHLAHNLPALTVLINGGEISRQDVANSLQAKRPVLVMQGTGRLADELALETPSELLHVVAANDAQAVASTIRMLLTRR